VGDLPEAVQKDDDEDNLTSVSEMKPTAS